MSNKDKTDRKALTEMKNVKKNCSWLEKSIQKVLKTKTLALIFSDSVIFLKM